MSKRSNPGIHFLATTILAVVFLGLNSLGKLDWLTAPINTIFSPLRRPLVSARYWWDSQLGMIKNLPHQERLINDLKRRSSELALEAERAKTLEQENASLRAALNVPTPLPHSLLPAKVISLARYAVIDQGSLLGVKPGQVAVWGNTVLGEVVEVLPRTARVRLLPDPETNIQAQTFSGAVGTLTYQNNTLLLTSILQKDTVEIEEPVYTKGSEHVPSGLLLGVIKSVEQNPTSIHKTAVIEAASKISDSQTLLVVLD